MGKSPIRSVAAIIMTFVPNSATPMTQSLMKHVSSIDGIGLKKN